MGMALAAISLPNTAGSCRARPYFSFSFCNNNSNFRCFPSLSSSSAFLQPRSGYFNIPYHSLRFRAAAASNSSSAMSFEAPQKKIISPDSFLDHKESGFLHFVKYHGLGNHVVLVDNRDSTEPKATPEQAIRLCDRNFGIEADGVIFAMPGTNGSDYTMRIFNSDGSEPEMCGNGVRCFAKFIAELENLHGRHSFTIHIGAGLIVPEIQEDGKPHSAYGHSHQINHD